MEGVKLASPVRLPPEGDGESLSLSCQNVVVLSQQFKLSRSQSDLLSKGLTFVPSPIRGRDHRAQLQFDLQSYHRKIKLIDYFKKSTPTKKRPFTGVSNWTPSLTDISPEIRNLIKKDLKIFKYNYNSLSEIKNLKTEEFHALRELKKLKHIVIKPADKGSAIVIMDREQYIFEIERQLNEFIYYKKLDKPIFMETIPLVHDVLMKLKKKKFINAKQFQYLKGDLQPRERRFYTLPKIHKDPKTWTIPFEIPKGRPIVSDCGSETYFTAEFLDFYLKPLSNKHPSYVRDTYHFIELIKNLEIPSKFYFFSMDVASLYTNIDIEAGMNAVKRMFERYPDPKRPDEELLQLLDINLKRNDFMFDGQFYLQIKGTAMGKRFAPAYANIFMSIWEEEVFLKCLKKPLYYFRYLDDVWGIWEGSEKEFGEFLSVLNDHDPSIQLEAEINSQSIDFLDTTVFKGKDFEKTNCLDVKVHFKKTDLHALLFKSSFHPKHTFAGMVKSQLLRFYRICTREDDFGEAVSVLFKSLRNRGYSRQFLKKCLRNFRLRQQKDGGDLIPLITTFDSVSKALDGMWKNNFRNVKGPECFPNCRVLSAFRRNANLKDLLVFAKLPSLQVQKPPRSMAQFSRLKFIENSKEKTVLRVSQSFSMRSCNCVYVLFCVKCNLKYVGESKNSLATRLTQHRYNVRNKKELQTLVVQHFLLHGWDSLRMAGLQRSDIWTDWERRKVERRWIYLLGTKEPHGLNMKP